MRKLLALALLAVALASGAGAYVYPSEPAQTDCSGNC
jgi:hypothetical protein